MTVITRRPAPPILTDADLLGVYRVIDFSVDLLDQQEKYIGPLPGVAPGGSLSFSTSTSIHSGGTLPVEVDKDAVDWLHSRIRIGAIMSDLQGNTKKTPLGIYLPAIPSSAYNGYSVVMSVTLNDKLQVLNDTVPMDDNDEPIAFSIPGGSNVLQTVKSLIEAAGESAPAIVPDDQTITNVRSYDAGETILSIINDLLHAAGYFSLYCDLAGQFRADVYTVPRDRPVSQQELSPFVVGTSLVDPSFTLEEDLSEVPNMYVARSLGDGTTPGEFAFAVDDDPNSPYSYQARGRWIVTVTDEEEDTVDAPSLQTSADDGLVQAQSVVAKFTVNHDFIPDLAMNDVVHFQTPDWLGGFNKLCSVSTITVPLEAAKQCETVLHGVVDLNPQQTGPVGPTPTRPEPLPTPEPSYMTTLNLPVSPVTGSNHMQSMAMDPVSGELYVAQALGGATDDMLVYRMTRTGLVLDYAVLTGGGHGNSIEVENDNGTVYVWNFWGGAAPGPGRWKYSGTVDGKTVLKSDPDVEALPDMNGGAAVEYSIDVKNDHLGVWRAGSGATRYMQLRKLSEFKAGTDNVLQSITYQKPADSAFQGFQTVDGYVFTWGGGAYGVGAPNLTKYSWSTGQQIVNLDYSSLGLVDGKQVGGNEAEGVTIWRDASGTASLILGVVTGDKGSNHNALWSVAASVGGS